MSEVLAEGVDQSIVEFCRFARAHGLPASVKESLSALEAAGVVGMADRETLKAALRSVLCSSKSDWDHFDELFEAFWKAEQNSRLTVPRDKRAGSTHELASREKPGLMLPADSNAPISEDHPGKVVLGATAHERLKQADFSQVAHSDLPDLERLALRLLRQMSLRLSRRLKVSKLRDKVDLRRTIRHSISRGGELIELSFRGRKLQQQRLVILLDISGSMNPYSLFLVRF